jgi:hypothetical protein
MILLNFVIKYGASANRKIDLQTSHTPKFWGIRGIFVFSGLEI